MTEDDMVEEPDAGVYKLPIAVSLAIIAALLGGSVVASLPRPVKRTAPQDVLRGTEPGSGVDR